MNRIMKGRGTMRRHSNYQKGQVAFMIAIALIGVLAIGLFARGSVGFIASGSVSASGSGATADSSSNGYPEPVPTIGNECAFTAKDISPSETIDGPLRKNGGSAPGQANDAYNAGLGACGKKTKYDEFKKEQILEDNGNKKLCVEMTTSGGQSCKYSSKLIVNEKCVLESCTQVIVNTGGGATLTTFPKSKKVVNSATGITSYTTIISDQGGVSIPLFHTFPVKKLTKEEFDALKKKLTHVSEPAEGDVYWYCTFRSAYNIDTYACTV